MEDIVFMHEKVVIVIGGAGGIGESISKHFAKEDINVVIADLDLQAAQSLSNRLKSREQESFPVHVDVTDEDSVISVVKKTVEKYGRVDYMAYCAGNNIKSPTLELTLDQWNSALATHLTGAFLFCREVGREMVVQGEGGRIVLLSSVAAMAPIPERGAYGASKAGLINLAGMLSLEWARYGINVNTVCPGVALTPMTQMVYERDPDLREQRLKRTPLAREVLPEEIADLVFFLCSDKASYITGVAIPIDGGFLNSGFLPEEIVKRELR